MGLSRDDITTIASRTGRRVVAAWSGRNAGEQGEIYGVVMHHTGSAWGTATAPTLGIVRDGRSDLPNALSNYYIDRAGTIYLITEKIPWHAGQGYYRGITDANGHMLGIEAESDGVHWTDETIDSYVALVGEICRFLGVDVETWAIRHATWATPRGRKTDFSGMSEAAFKTRVSSYLAGESDMPLNDADIERIKHAVAEAPIGGTKIGGGRDVMLWQLLGRLDTDLRGDLSAKADTLQQILALAAEPPVAPVPVDVDAAAVADALVGSASFVEAIAESIASKLAVRMQS